MSAPRGDVERTHDRAHSSAHAQETFEESSRVIAFLIWLNYTLAMLLGELREVMYRLGLASARCTSERPELKVCALALSTGVMILPQDFAPLYDSFGQVFHRYIYRNKRDCWNQPICRSVSVCS